MKEHFKDDKTAFVFTSDHGMSKLGNHGDGEPDNTRTPLVVWGSGVRSPRAVGDSRGRSVSQEKGDQDQEWRLEERAKDQYFRGWGELDEVWREDVEQGDITPLMVSCSSQGSKGNKACLPAIVSPSIFQSLGFSFVLAATCQF